MVANITFAQFNKIASGDYNAGQIDFRTKDDGSTELVKVNNHVWKTSKNQTILSPERILVKSISMKELGLGLRAGEAETVAAIKKDARDMPGENSYQVDIGV